MRKLFIVAAVLAVAFAATNADAGALRQISFGAGYVSPDNVSGTWTVGAGFDFALPVSNLYIQPNAGYWNYSEDASFAGITASSSIRDIFFGGNAKYMFATSAPKLHPYVQAGVAVHMISLEADILGLASISDTETKIGLQAGGGLAYDVAERWGVFGQGNLHLVSDFNQWSVGGGVQFRL